MLTARLLPVQEALVILLGDSHGLTQEAATKALSACYALAVDDGQRQQLVDGFVMALQGARNWQGVGGSVCVLTACPAVDRMPCC